MPVALPLTNLIDQSASMKRSFRVKKAEFGNGYEQVAPDGINPARDEWSIPYVNLTSGERDTVLAALNAVQGWDYLTWLAPGDIDAKKWRMTEQGYSMSSDGNLWTINVNLRQIY